MKLVENINKALKLKLLKEEHGSLDGLPDMYNLDEDGELEKTLEQKYSNFKKWLDKNNIRAFEFEKIEFSVSVSEEFWRPINNYYPSQVTYGLDEVVDFVFIAHIEEEGQDYLKRVEFSTKEIEKDDPKAISDCYEFLYEFGEKYIEEYINQNLK